MSKRAEKGVWSGVLSSVRFAVAAIVLASVAVSPAAEAGCDTAWFSAAVYHPQYGSYCQGSSWHPCTYCWDESTGGDCAFDGVGSCQPYRQLQHPTP
jgi:hypothetical protein